MIEGRNASLACPELRAVEILPNFVFSLVPIVPKTVRITTLMRPAIRPYSMAVAPDVSALKRRSRLDIGCLGNARERLMPQPLHGWVRSD